MPIRLTRWAQSCVRIEGSAGALVIDPGVYGESATVLAGAEGVLLTHDHVDHVDGSAVAASGLPVWGPAAALDVVAEAGADRARLHEVRAGDELTLGGLDVQVVGEWHAVIHPELRRGTNVGYLVAAVLPPGDAFVVPPSGAVVEVALTPVSGPWLRMADAVDWVRSVGAARAVPIHDAWLSEAGLRSAGDWLARLTSATVVAARPGELVELRPAACRSVVGHPVRVARTRRGATGDAAPRSGRAGDRGRRDRPATPGGTGGRRGAFRARPCGSRW